MAFKIPKINVGLPNILPSTSGDKNFKNYKKLLEEKNQERSKIYGFIGMDVYDLYKQGKIDIPELSVHFEKMEALEAEIEELNAEKQRQEILTKGSSVCSCGQPLTAENLFCPSCGKPVDNGMITCSCGKTVKSDMQFCSFCGRDLQMEKQRAQSIAPQVRYRECICGAQVPEGQFMCMECGRKIED